MDKIGYKPTIIAAWGIAGNLGELAGPLANGVRVMQTFTWMGDMDRQDQGDLGQDPEEVRPEGSVRNQDGFRHRQRL